MSKRRPQDFRPEGHYFGVVVGVVTNNQDPENLGRLKVKFPWLFDNDESYWARLAMPMAGTERGWWFNPEVDDEVLVAFLHGDVHHPFIVGSLWNGEDTQPDGLKNAEGTNDTRMIKSRSGHKLIFFDKDGEEHVQILDKTLANWWKLDSAENSQTINSDSGHMNLYAPAGQITWEASEISVKIGGDVTFDVGADHTAMGGSTTKIEGGPGMTWKAPMININASGATAGAVGGISASAGSAMERVDSEAVEWAAYSAAAIAAAGEVSSAEEAEEPPEDSSAPAPDEPKALVNASWGSDSTSADAGEAVPISATVDNVPDGTAATIRIYDRAGNLVSAIESSVDGGAVSADWTPEVAPGGVPEFTVEIEADGLTSASSVLSLTGNIDVTVRDDRGVALAGAEVEIVLGDSTNRTEFTDADGKLALADVYAGEFEIRAIRPSEIAAEGEPAEAGEFDGTLPYRAGMTGETGKTLLVVYDLNRALNNARWSAEMVRLGESAQLLVDASGLTGTDATVRVFLVLGDEEHDLGEVPATIDGDVVSVDWSLAEFDEALEPTMVRGNFKPELYFVITADDKNARSARVPVVDWFEVEVKDPDGNALVDVKYTLVLPDGSARKGKTNAEGLVREEDVPHGKCQLVLDDEEFAILA